MNMYVFMTIVTVLLSAHVYSKKVYQPQFEYQYEVLQKLLDLKTKNGEIESAVDGESQHIEVLTAMLQNTYETISYLNATVNSLKSQTYGTGSSYIRWGKTTCDGDAEVVYEGYAAGAYYGDSGSGSNYICVTTEPKWGEYNDEEQYIGRLYGVEYATGRGRDHQDAPCVVCRIPRSNVLMTPGTNGCQDGWNMEYSGYLVSQAYNEYSKEFVCLDEDPGVLTSGNSVDYGGLFRFVEGYCGALKCPPYVKYRELTCSVCSYGPRNK